MTQGKKPKRLYKFLRTDLKSEHGNFAWEIGKWYKTQGDLSICNNGFHASQKPMQALGYVAGELLALVEVRGESVIEDDKECWEEMRLLKVWHWKKENSVALAIFAAEQVIDIYEKKYPDDKRPRAAIEAAKAFLKNPSEENRKEAAAAARAAAWTAAARAAAWAAVAAEAAAEARVAWAAVAAAEAARAAVAAAAAEAAAEGARADLRSKLDQWFVAEIKTLEEYN